MPTQTAEVGDRRKRLNEWADTNPFRVWRKTSGQNASDFGHIGTPNSFKNWERGHVRPSAEKMADLASEMGISQVKLEAQWTDWEVARPR
jgi:hypothetical protein